MLQLHIFLLVNMQKDKSDRPDEKQQETGVLVGDKLYSIDSSADPDMRKYLKE
jgi:hypothetical protein